MAGFKLLKKGEQATAQDRAMFSAELVGKEALAFKKAAEEAEISLKDAALQMVRHCLKESGYLKE